MILRDRLRAAGFRAARRLLMLRRPSPRATASGLAARGETLAQLTVREAAADDIPALAALHVTTWNDTYALLLTGPSVAVREQQWRRAFARSEGWFCAVVTRPDGTLIGFTKGVWRPEHAIPGELNKLFLARDYQRLGLGRRLVGEVARRFVASGVATMAAYVEPRNPSCAFFERLGARWLREPDGRVNFSWYVWDDLSGLVRRCAPPSPGGGGGPG